MPPVTDNTDKITNHLETISKHGATQPVIPAKAGIYGLWSDMPAYQEGQLILR